jgi:ADP-ribose pyrophosphatase
VTERPLGTRTVYEGGFVQVDRETWPGGEYEVIRRTGPARAGAAGLVALTPQRDVILIRAFRQPVRQDLLEIPAGLLDREGEDPIACASRELKEETGFSADGLEFLAGFFTTAGLSDEYVHLFLGTCGSEPTAEPDGEAAEVVRMPFERAVLAARTGRIRDAKTIIGLLLADARLTRAG